MATISDINTAASYRGTKELGGSQGVGITIDPSPIARLATFTFYKNRDLWELKQKKDVLAAQQIADIAAFDTNSPFREYTDDLTKEVNELQNDIRKDPSIVVYDRNKPEKWIEMQQRVGRIENKRKHATVNDTLFNAAKAKIELIQNKEQRDKELRLLELSAKELFKNGLDEGYRKQFQATPELKPEDYKIRSIPLTKTFTITRNANDTVIDGKAFADMDRVDALADAVYFGLKQPLNENTPEFKAMSPDEQERTRIEDSITSRARVNLDNIAGNVNELVQSFRAKYDTPESKVKVGDIPDDELAQSGSIGGFIRLTKGYNKQVDQINLATGKKYPHINLDDGATPQEIIKLQSFSENGETLYKELKPTVQQTDNAIQLRGQNITDRHNRAMEGIDRDKFDFDKAKFKEATQGAEESKNAAIVFANGLFSDLLSKASIKLVSGGGVLTPDDLRTLTADQLKFLGKELPVQRDADGKVIESAGLQPLTLADNEVMQVNPDGTVLVMTNASYDSKKKKYGGEWDNTRSTSVWNAARNVLNEENVKSGTKERNAYLPIDLRSRKPVIQVDQSGGGSSNTTQKTQIKKVTVKGL